MVAIVDRIEGEYVILECEDGVMARMSKSLLPNAHDGDVVRIESDAAATSDRALKIKKRMDALWKD
ncbi:MAG: DUF3006 domain-containing protein [Clostridia bacterium]